MPERVDAANADHYVWDEVSDGWRLLDSAGLPVIEERAPVGAGEEWHVYDRATQFYVLEGTAQLQTVDGIVDLVARRGFEIPPGFACRFFNPGENRDAFPGCQHAEYTRRATHGRHLRLIGRCSGHSVSGGYSDPRGIRSDCFGGLGHEVETARRVCGEGDGVDPRVSGAATARSPAGPFAAFTAVALPLCSVTLASDSQSWSTGRSALARVMVRAEKDSDKLRAAETILRSRWTVRARR